MMHRRGVPGDGMSKPGLELGRKVHGEHPLPDVLYSDRHMRVSFNISTIGTRTKRQNGQRMHDDPGWWVPLRKTMMK